MSEMPGDVIAAANAEIAKGDMAFITVARAILAERKRCAEVARQYITDVGFPRAYADRCASEIMEASQ